MTNYHRYYIPDAINFITLVTNGRRPYLKSDPDLSLFSDTLQKVQQIHPFILLAYVYLPDHLHLLMKVQHPNGNFSPIIQSLKWNFTLNYKKTHQLTGSVSLWQRGFWDHVIRDEQDLKNHIDYIHWNPMKHGLVEDPATWKYSSYVSWQNEGYYPIDGLSDIGEPN